MARDDTSVLEGGGQFPSTRASLVYGLGGADEQTRREILDRIIRAYWRPVYVYLRRLPMSNDDAKDVTQGFFCEIVLTRRLIDQAQPAETRFRTLLLKALQNYVRDRHAHDHRKKRRPSVPLLPLAEIDPGDALIAGSAGDPETGFHHAWAVDLLRGALEQVERNCRQKKQVMHWALFAAMFADPLLKGTARPSLASLCGNLGVTDEATARNLLETPKRQFREACRQAVRPLVEHESEVESEIGDLLRILAVGAAPSAE